LRVVKELLARVEMTRTTLSKTLTELEELGLVNRPRSNREAWGLRYRDEIRRLLSAAAHLAATVGATDVKADRDLAERTSD
jgi:DNA-binding MarR family transcriptional regulator